MKKQTTWMRWLLGAVAVMVFVLGTAAVYPQTAEAATPTDVTAGRRGGQGPLGDGLRGGEQSEFLAEALGISVEELQAAQTAAHAAALDAAVEAGLITEEQATQLQERGKGRLPMMGRMGDSPIDHKALLAEALGISVEDLDAAQTEAHAAALAQAVADGDITQEQADHMAARHALQPYLQEAMQGARDEAIAQAVADGVITQEQADAFLSQDGFGGFGKGMRGHGGRGHGGFEGSNGSQGRGTVESEGIFGMFRGMLNGFQSSDS